jgi:hypothetical protein
VFLPLAPFWFLSFMPKALVTCGGKGEPACSWSFGGPGSYRALNHPPDDWNDWYNLVQVGPYLCHHPPGGGGPPPPPPPPPPRPPARPPPPPPAPPPQRKE